MFFFCRLTYRVTPREKTSKSWTLHREHHMSSPRLEMKRPSSPPRRQSSKREGRSRSRSYSSSRSSSFSPDSSYSSRSRSPSLENDMSDAKFERMDKKDQLAFVQRKEANTLLMQKHHAERLEIIARKVCHLPFFSLCALTLSLFEYRILSSRRLKRAH